MNMPQGKVKVFSPVAKALRSPWGYVEWLLISLAIFVLLIMIPVWTTPGNDFFFQLSILDTVSLTTMIVLSIANGLLIKMQLYIRKEVKQQRRLQHDAKKGATLMGIMLSSLAATVACAACYSTVLAFIGLGTAAFLVEYRVWFALGALAITSIAIYYSAKRINHHCEVCTVHFDKSKKKDS